MNGVNYCSLEISALVTIYKKAARLHSQSMLTGDHVVTNEQHDIISAVYRELRSRGVNYQNVLLSLLDDPDPQIRVWAAAHAMEFAPDRGLPILLDLAREKGLLGHCAQMVVQEWQKGTLGFP